MAKIRVYPFKKWDQDRGENIVSQCLATREAVHIFQAEVIEAGAIDVDESELDDHRRYKQKPMCPLGTGTC